METNEMGIAVGDRIELHPATDAWMFGDRFGAVVKVTRRTFHVKMDTSGRVLRVSPKNVYKRVGMNGELDTRY